MSTNSFERKDRNFSRYRTEIEKTDQKACRHNENYATMLSSRMFKYAKT